MAELINIGTTPNDGTGDKLRDAFIKTNSFISDSIIRVKTSSDFGVIDSTKVYVIDGVVDMTGVELEVPSGGINLMGYTFDVSKMICSDSNYTMFKSPIRGSGNFVSTDIAYEVTGANSKVFDLQDATGFNAFEINNTNFNNCTSLGELNSYRQGFESGTGRFGGTPELTLSGDWLGGYYIDSSIVRMLKDGSYFLYKAGLGFTMASRFRSNQNIDLNSTVGFLNFTTTNFTRPNTLQLSNCLVSRNGVIDPTDTTIIPNIKKSDIQSVWRNNLGIENTFVGGCINVTTEVLTTISTVSTFVDLNGTFSDMDLQHFDHSVNGQLKHIGNGVRNYNVFLDMIIEGGANDELELKLVVWDDSAGVFVDYKSVKRVVNNFQGGRDVAFFNFMSSIVLDQNDYLKVQVANNTDTTNVTAELNSEIRITER